MKDTFESKIKSLVEDYSYDYDPKAWDGLSKKLPKAKPGVSWLGKFGIASLLALLVGIVGWSSLSSENQKPAKNTASQKAITTPKKAKSTSPALAAQTPTESKQQDGKPTTFSQPDATTAQLISCTFPTPYIDLMASDLERSTLRTLSEINAITTPLPLPTISQTTPVQMAQNNAPTSAVPSNCQGLKLLLDVDAMNYEDGTPRIRVNLETNGSDITWSANGTLVNKKSRSVDLMAFKGQTYTITAEAQLDGCKSTEKIKVTAYEDYNLLAVNAFNPESRDERNATFMPYALTIRDVHFELLILDPENGAVVFRTTDAQNAWDGIDQRSGQLVPAQKAYIWKVVLQEALPNEKTTYSGTIVRI
jgi:hypothetical protein